jgi:hypothetical protein
MTLRIDQSSLAFRQSHLIRSAGQKVQAFALPKSRGFRLSYETLPRRRLAKTINCNRCAPVLGVSSILIVFENMKTKTLLQIHSIPRLLFMVPVICSIAFAACSDVAGTAGTHPTVNLHSAAVGEPQSGDTVTIAPGQHVHSRGMRIAINPIETH